MSSKFSYEEYVHLGKQSYREKRYDAALGHFQNALRLAKSSSLEILDSLAAVSEKLGDLDASLRYGKQMLQCDATSSKGYLRIGRTLQSKSDSKAKELAIYDRGLQKTLVSDPQRKMLESLRHRLDRELNPPESYDPLSVLPAEIVHMIISYIKFHELVLCLRVSKGWQSYLAAQPWLWQHVDLSTGKTSAQKRLPAKSLQQWAKWSHFNIKTADLGAFSHRQSVVALAIKCKSLSSLTFDQESSADTEVIVTVLKHAKQLKTLLCNQPIPARNALVQVLAHAQSLVHLELVCMRDITLRDREGVPMLDNLRHFSLQGSQDSSVGCVIGCDEFNQLLSYMPNLESLRLSRLQILSSSPFGHVAFDTLTGLKSLRMHYFHTDINLRLPPSLELFVSERVRLRFEPIEQRPVWLPNLRCIELTRCFGTLDTVEALLVNADSLPPALEMECPFEKFSQLDTLKLEAVQWDNQPAMTAMFQTNFRAIFQHPRVLDIKTLSVDAPEFDNDTIDMIKENLRKLQVVRLTNTTVTGVGIKSLVQSQPDLGWLLLENCTSVSADAVAWAKSQGVKVVNNIKLLPRATAGRAIRYG